MGALAVGLVVLIGLASPAFAKKEPKPGEIVVRVSPRMALGRALVTAVVEIPKPTPEMYCPEVTIEVWGEPLCDAGAGRMEPCSRLYGMISGPERQRTSVQESDCQPWEDHPRLEKGVIYPASSSVPFIFVYRMQFGPGAWEIRIALKQGKKKKAFRETVEVH